LIKSPLRYPGGKSKAVNFISKFFPKEFKELREPMMGGASVTFYCVQKYPRAKFLAGDINYDLYCFWKELKENKDRLVEEVKLIKLKYKDGRKLFEEIMERRAEDKDDFQRAVDFFVLNRITFSGTVDCGGYSEQAFRNRFTWSSIERLEKAHEVIRKVDLYFGDYEEIMNAEGEDVVVFLDPPYYSAQKSKLYGKKGDLHTGFDHERLYRVVKDCPHKVVITYDNSEYIRELYRDFYTVEWELSYGMTNYRQDKVRVGSELIIANFPIDKYVERLSGSLFQKVVSYSGRS